MKKVYNEKIIRKKILRAWKHTKEDLIGRETTQMPEHKITFNIIYYPAFENVRGIMEELNLLLTSNQKHKKAFPNVPVIGSCNGKSVKDSLVRATLPILNDNGRCEACGEKKLFCTFVVNFRMLEKRKPNLVIGLPIMKANMERLD